MFDRCRTDQNHGHSAMTTRTLNKLTAGKVVTAKGPARLADGGHLYLQVGPTHSKRWVFIYARGGRQRELALGPFPAVSLAVARTKRDKLNAALANGEPLSLTRDDKAKTFREVADELIARRGPTWRGKGSAYHWRISIEKHCAALVARPIAAITGDEVLRVLAPLNDRAPSFAAITRSRLEQIFTYAQARGLLPQDKANPADRRRLQILLPVRRAVVHRAALPYNDVSLLIAELSDSAVRRTRGCGASARIHDLDGAQGRRSLRRADDGVRL